MVVSSERQIVIVGGDGGDGGGENGNGGGGYPVATAAAAGYEELVQSSELFWEKLKAFHRLLGTKFTIPTVGGKSLDLHRLFVEVTSRGGLEKVVRDRRWKEVIAVFQYPTTITSASFVLRKYYMSLLYRFEWVYFFGRQGTPFSTSDSGSGDDISGSAVHEDGAPLNVLPSHEYSKLIPGCSVTGIIDGKFEGGYLVTVNLGDQEMKGVLYHLPKVSHSSRSQITHALELSDRRRRKRSRKALRDPFRPKSNRSGYNFFFAEHYARLKPQYHGQERAISKKIGFLWNNLTEAEKQVYQDKGLKDKERYKTEMLEYRSSQQQQQTPPPNHL
ncbi:hypothetical protein MLD38_001890 [Melastoma candidum]|uniref:Uncharacterized protein n=1 Tax=Melastoma candidum TaxID=119954 RepID=A0ACB9SFN1_9MYRT|nr:hypothetical protein MLD38_001890 [Melastoma candidum]